MNNELPYQTFERVTGKKWTGGNSPDVQSAYKQYGITAPAGSAEGNLALQKALMGGTQAAPQTTVNQAPQPEPKVANIPTSPFVDTEMSDFEKEKQDYLASLTNQPQVDRQSELNKFQAQIDAVNSMYAAELERAKIAGKGRLGTTTAITGRRGLIGSDFGEAQVRGTEQLNEDVYKSIENERNAKIQSIMSEARNYADEQERNRREQMLAGFEARTAYYKQKDERKRQNVTSAVQALIAQGLDPMELGNLKEFASYYGLNENDIKTNYKTEKERIEKERQAEMLKNFPTKELSQGEALMVWNPATGKYEQQGYNPKTSVAKTGGSGGTGGVSGGRSSNQYASDLDAIIGNTVATIPSKFGQEQFNNQLSRARNDADKINLIASVVLKNAPAPTKQDFSNQSIAISNIDKAIAEIDKGAKSGFINSKLQKGFNLFGRDYDPALAGISAYITSAIQPYRSSVTGAAWGAQEEAEYQQLFGSTLYSPTELKQRLTRLKEIMRDKSAQGLNVFVNPMGTYDNPFVNNSVVNNQVNQTGTVTVYSIKTGKPAQIPSVSLQQALSSGLFRQ